MKWNLVVKCVSRFTWVSWKFVHISNLFEFPVVVFVCLCRSNMSIGKVVSLYSENKTTALRNTFTSISESNWAQVNIYTQLEKNWQCYKRYQRQCSKIHNVLWKNKLKPSKATVTIFNSNHYYGFTVWMCRTQLSLTNKYRGVQMRLLWYFSSDGIFM